MYLARLFNWFWTRQHCSAESTDPLTCMREPDVRLCTVPLPLAVIPGSQGALGAFVLSCLSPEVTLLSAPLRQVHACLPVGIAIAPLSQ